MKVTKRLEYIISNFKYYKLIYIVIQSDLRLCAKNNAMVNLKKKN